MSHENSDPERGAIVRAARESQGLSLVQVAERCFIPVGRLADIESGAYHLDVAEFVSLSHVLGISREELCGLSAYQMKVAGNRAIRDFLGEQFLRSQQRRMYADRARQRKPGVSQAVRS